MVPILAVWVDGRIYFSAGKRTRKAKDLAHDSSCVISVEEPPLDLALEGTAAKVREEATLLRVAEAYADAYGWRVAVRDNAFHDGEGAGTAGPPPYDVYEVQPAVGFGFGLDGTLTATRWRF